MPFVTKRGPPTSPAYRLQNRKAVTPKLLAKTLALSVGLGDVLAGLPSVNTRRAMTLRIYLDGRDTKHQKDLSDVKSVTTKGMRIEGQWMDVSTFTLIKTGCNTVCRAGHGASWRNLTNPFPSSWGPERPRRLLRTFLRAHAELALANWGRALALLKSREMPHR